MTEKAQQTIKELLAKLPKEAQDTINAVDWIKISEEIGNEYLFDEGDVNVFQTITGLVLAGMTSPDFYAKRIEEEVSIGTERAEEIRDEAVKRIFTPMADKRMGLLKANLKGSEPAWHQNVDFILSGGDYTAFFKKPENDSGDGPLTDQKV